MGEGVRALLAQVIAQCMHGGTGCDRVG
jgi:hypothetical protein